MSVPMKKSEAPVSGLQSAINRLFDDFRTGFEAGWPRFDGERFPFSPSIDVKEDGESITVTAELPGLTEKDVELVFDKGHLVLRGEKKEVVEERKDNYYRKESRCGRFERVIPLPVEVQQDQLSATLAKGVLTVTLPKSPAALSQQKKIAIKAGN